MSRDVLGGAPIFKRAVYRALFTLVPLLPLPLWRLAGWGGGLLVWWLDGRGRSRVRANLAPLIPAGRIDARERCVRRSFQYFLMTVFEMAWVPRAPASYWQDIPVVDPCGQMRDPSAPGPSVVCSGHCNWEVALHVVSAHGWPASFVGVALSHQDPEIDAMFDAVRGLAGLRPVDLDNAPLASLRALRSGQTVALLGDRDYSGHGRPYPVGRGRLRMPLGVAGLALQCGVPIRPVFFMRRSWSRFVLVVPPPLHPGTTAGKQVEMDRLMRRWGVLLGRVLQAAPANWVAFHAAGWSAADENDEPAHH